MTGDQGEPIQISDIHKHWWKIAGLCVCTWARACFWVWCRECFADRCMRLVCVLTDDERCWMIRITYGFLLDWLDSVITACMDGGGEVLRHMWFYSFSCLAFAKLWEANVGHWDSYVPFDLQLSTRVHFQVRSAEKTEVKGWLQKRRRWRKKTFSDTFSSLLAQWDLM